MSTFFHERNIHPQHSPPVLMLLTYSYAIAPLPGPSSTGVICLFASVVQLTLLRLGTSVKSMQKLAHSQSHQPPINRASAAGLRGSRCEPAWCTSATATQLQPGA